MNTIDSLGPSPVHFGIALSLSFAGSLVLWRLSSPETNSSQAAAISVPVRLQPPSELAPPVSPRTEPTTTVEASSPADLEAPPEPVAYLGGPTASQPHEPDQPAPPPPIDPASLPAVTSEPIATNANTSAARPPTAAPLTPATLTAATSNSDLPAADALFENGIYMPAFAIHNLTLEHVRELAERGLCEVVVFCGEQRFLLQCTLAAPKMQTLTRHDRGRLSRRGITAPATLVRQALELLRVQYGLTTDAARATQVRVVLTLPLDAVIRSAQQQAAQHMGLPIDQLKCTRGHLEWREPIDRLFVVDAVDLADGRSIELGPLER